MSEATTSNPEQLGPDELRTLFLFEALGFLFEALGDEPLDWLASNGRVEIVPAGSLVYGEGEDATCFFVLLTGTLPMHRQVGDTEMEITLDLAARGVRRCDPDLRRPPRLHPLSQHGAGGHGLRILGHRRPAFL